MLYRRGFSRAGAAYYRHVAVGALAVSYPRVEQYQPVVGIPSEIEAAAVREAPACERKSADYVADKVLPGVFLANFRNLRIGRGKVLVGFFLLVRHNAYLTAYNVRSIFNACAAVVEILLVPG